MSEKQCPKCGRNMQVGVLAGAPGWAPKKTLGIFKGKKMVAYRCEERGYIELYAKWDYI